MVYMIFGMIKMKTNIPVCRPNWWFILVVNAPRWFGISHHKDFFVEKRCLRKSLLWWKHPRTSFWCVLLDCFFDCLTFYSPIFKSFTPTAAQKNTQHQKWWAFLNPRLMLMAPAPQHWSCASLELSGCLIAATKASKAPTSNGFFEAQRDLYHWIFGKNIAQKIDPRKSSSRVDHE